MSPRLYNAFRESIGTCAINRTPTVGRITFGGAWNNPPPYERACEHCSTVTPLETQRIVHLGTPQRAKLVCSKCFETLRPGADHSKAPAGKLTELIK